MSINLNTQKIQEIEDNFIESVGYFKRVSELNNDDGGEWVPCDGRFLCKETYSELYKFIGSAHGDDGNGHFAVPNMPSGYSIRIKK